MWPMLDFAFMKPACSWRSSLSTADVMRRRMMRQKTLLVMDSSVMPLQLLHWDRFNFLEVWWLYPSSKRPISLHCPRRPEGCVEEAVAFSVLLLSASLHAHCRPLVHYSSSAS